MTICGEIDLYTAPRLHSELAGLLAEGMPTRVVIDMSGVEFCDSTGMNVLLSCLRRARGTVRFGSWSLMSRVDFMMITRS